MSHGVLGRSTLVPIDAHPLGDGRSVTKPTATTALVFDDSDGSIVARCSGIAASRTANDLTSADVAGCVRGAWASVSGVIRFSASLPPDATRARDTTPAVSTAFTLAGIGYPEPADCSSEPMMGVRFVSGGSQHVASVALGAVPCVARRR